MDDNVTKQLVKLWEASIRSQRQHIESLVAIDLRLSSIEVKVDKLIMSKVETFK